MNRRLTATFQIKLIRAKKFSTGKVPHSIFSLMYEIMEKGMKNVKPTGDGPVASKVLFVRANFDIDLDDKIITATVIFYVDPSAKAILESVKSNFKKEFQKLGWYKIINQKTQYH